MELHPEEDRRKPAGAGEVPAKSLNRNKYSVTLVKVNQASLNDLFESMIFNPGKKLEIPNLVIQVSFVVGHNVISKKKNTLFVHSR